MREMLATAPGRSRAARPASYADLSLVPKMADSPERGDRLPARPGAPRARRTPNATWPRLRDFAAERTGPARPAGLGPPSSSEQLKEARYAFSEQEVKQYFTEPRVLDGLFRIVETLFEVRHPPGQRLGLARSVRFFRVERPGTAMRARAGRPVLPRPVRPPRQAAGRLDGRCARPLAAARGRRCRRRWRTWSATSRRRSDGKPGAADARRRDHAVPRVRPRPAPHADAGRRAGGVRHLGRRVGRGRAAEPVHGELLLGVGRAAAPTAHVDTGEPLPRALFDKMLAARNFQSGLQTLRQLEFSLFDMRLHPEPAPPSRVQRSSTRCAPRSPCCAAAVQPLPEQLLAHLRRRLCRRLLQLQVGRGAVGRRLGAPSRKPGVFDAEAGDVSAARSCRSVAAARRSTTSGPSAAASPPSTRCCVTRESLEGRAHELG